MKKLLIALLFLLLVTSLCACNFTIVTNPTETPSETPTEAPTSPSAEYTIQFEFNGGLNVDGGASIVTMPDGKIAVMPIPTKEGCVFAGWYLDAELTNGYFFDFPLNKNATLYAKFYDATLDGYIVLSNVDQLMAIKDNPTAKYILACDINCKGNTLEPISEFSGELEGNGYKIYNYTMSENAVNVALIRTNTGTVKNLSFGDFTFDIKRDCVDDKFYGVICGINYGTVENCTVYDSELKIECKDVGGDYTLYIGGIAGLNCGNILDCKNNATINVALIHGGYGIRTYVYPNIGGLIGVNEDKAIVRNCINRGDVRIISETLEHGYSYYNIGGLAGTNYNDLLASGSCSDIGVNLTGTGDTYIKLGGAVGSNGGAVQNCSADGKIIIDNSYVCTNECLIGGFVGYTCGKLYNCYSTCDITDITATIKAIGGFAGYNEKLVDREYVIHKCFSTGSISISGTAENVGKFVGISTGTEKDCCYLDTVTITKTTVTEETETTEEVVPTNDIGMAKTEGELLSADFLENTMYFDRMVWFLIDGKLPTLR